MTVNELIKILERDFSDGGNFGYRVVSKNGVVIKLKGSVDEIYSDKKQS